MYQATEPVPETTIPPVRWLLIARQLEQRAESLQDTDPELAGIDRRAAEQIRADYEGAQA